MVTSSVRSPFDAFVAEQRAAVAAALERYLPSPPACPDVIHDAMRYAIRTGGKRLRPLLALASADAVTMAVAPTQDARADARRLALPSACAVEFIHTQSLVHDDLPSMDDDVLRRGHPTVHVKYGEGMAILVGDGLLAQAFALLATEPATTDRTIVRRKLRVIDEVCAAVGPKGMVAGQAMDLTQTASDLATLADLHGRKTGGLIRAAATAGAVMAGGSAPQVDAVRRFAERLGLAFQILDDVLDVEGCSASMGKTPGKDAAAGKLTYASAMGVTAARRLADQTLAEAEAALEGGDVWPDYLREFARTLAARRC